MAVTYLQTATTLSGEFEGSVMRRKGPQIFMLVRVVRVWERESGGNAVVR